MRLHLLQKVVVRTEWDRGTGRSVPGLCARALVASALELGFLPTVASSVPSVSSLLVPRLAGPVATSTEMPQTELPTSPRRAPLPCGVSHSLGLTVYSVSPVDASHFVSGFLVPNHTLVFLPSPYGWVSPPQLAFLSRVKPCAWAVRRTH